MYTHSYFHTFPLILLLSGPQKRHLKWIDFATMASFGGFRFGEAWAPVGLQGPFADSLHWSQTLHILNEKVKSHVCFYVLFNMILNDRLMIKCRIGCLILMTIYQTYISGMCLSDFSAYRVGIVAVSSLPSVGHSFCSLAKSEYQLISSPHCNLQNVQHKKIHEITM